jgi:uroporphyrinogen-III decarboxylase
MTGRQRLLAAFHGEMPDRVPFSPNLYYWFYNHLTRGTLPAELAGARHPLAALRALGADILARWDTQHATREVYTAGEFSEEYGGDSRFDHPLVTAFNIYPPHRNRRIRKFVTPHGTLSQTWTLTEEAGADFESEPWWKDWNEYEAVRFLLESREYIFDAAEFHRWSQAAGDDGLMMVHVTQSPLKTFHWLAGSENASLFMLDHPEEMEALARIHEEKALRLIERIVDEPDAQVFISLDNLDSAFYAPALYRRFCQDFFAKAAEIIHSRNKIFVVHACGHNRALMRLVGDCRVDCLEGITPPPLGNVRLCEARRLTGYASFTVNGGMDSTHLELRDDAERALHEYVRELFAGMGDKHHFIFASSCTTPVSTPWENLLSLRDAAREYGSL